MPKASAPLPPRLSRKRFSPVSPATEQDAEVLLRFKHIGQYRKSPPTFDAALAMCRLQATLDDMHGADISGRPSKRRKYALISSTGSVISTIAAKSPSSQLSMAPNSAYGAAHPSNSLPTIGLQRYRMIDPTYGSARSIAKIRLFGESEGTPVPVMPRIPTIRISLKSLERLRNNLHKKPTSYRMIDPNYGSKKRMRD